MNSEDYFAFVYTALIILGVLLSLIPAYLASRRNKSFWVWWVSTACVFTILLLALIKAQAFPLSVYLVAIVPIASILAVLPRVSISSKPGISLKLDLARDNTFFLSILAILLVFGTALYFYVMSLGDGHVWIPKIYPVYLAVLILLACLGLASFIFLIVERRVQEIAASVFLVFLLVWPVFRKLSSGYAIPGVMHMRPETDILLVEPLITDLIRLPIAGLFILLGLCSGATAALLLLNDKYRVTSKIAAMFRSDDYSPPYIRFSGSRFLSVLILVFSLLFLAFFKVFFHPTENWIFFPFIYLCFTIPMFLLAVTGTVLSSVVIGISIKQKKNLYALGIFLCGLIAVWRGVPAGLPAPLYQYVFDLLVVLLVFYGIGSGFIALILWVISDYRGPSKIDGVNS